MAKQNKGRKFFAASATAALVASAIVPVASAAQVNDYNKISGYAKEAVQSLVDAGVIQGDTNGNFNPLNTVTRAQAAEIFTKALELEADGDVNFSDVKKGAWYYNSIAAVVANGIFEGVSANEFAPNKSLTRSEAAKVLVDAFGLEGSESLSQFADASQVKPWAKTALETAVANGIFTGSEENGKLNLKPNAAITRQDFAVVFARTLDLVDTETPVDAAIKAINNTTVEVTFDEEVDNVEALDFAIEGLEVKNAAVKQTNKKVVVLTTAAQTADKEYTVTLGGEKLGSFKGVSAVIPTKVEFVEQSVQGKLGQQVTIKAQVTVAEGASKAGIPVTLFVPGSADGIKAPVTVEAITDDKGVATHTYTRYAATTDTVTVYATGDRSKFSTGYVFWGVDTILAIEEVTTGATINNGANKTYKVTYKNDVTGKPEANKTFNVGFLENMNVTADKLANATVNGISVKQLSNGTALEAAQITTDSKGEATFTVSGVNATVTPVVYALNPISASEPTNNNKTYKASALQATTSKVVFAATQAEYKIEITRDGGEVAATGEANGREYKVVVKDKDGKVAKNETVNVAFNEDIDRVISTNTKAKFVDADTDKYYPTTSTGNTAKQISVKTNDKGEASFVIASDFENDYATPVAWIDINSANAKQGTLDEGEPKTVATISHFQAPYLDGAEIKAYKSGVTKSTTKFDGNETAEFKAELVNQSGKVFTGGYTVGKVTYTVFNTGGEDIKVGTTVISPNRSETFTYENGASLFVTSSEGKTTSVRVVATGTARKDSKDFAFTAKEATATFTATDDVPNSYTGLASQYNPADSGTDSNSLWFAGKKPVKYAGVSGKTFKYYGANGNEVFGEAAWEALLDGYVGQDVRVSYIVDGDTISFKIITVGNTAGTGLVKHTPAAKNNAPVAKVVGDQTIAANNTAGLTFTATQVASDADANDTLKILTAYTSDASVATAAVAGDQLSFNVSPKATGSTVVTLVVSDGKENVNVSFKVNVTAASYTTLLGNPAKAYVAPKASIAVLSNPTVTTAGNITVTDGTTTLPVNLVDGASVSDIATAINTQASALVSAVVKGTDVELTSKATGVTIVTAGAIGTGLAVTGSNGEAVAAQYTFKVNTVPTTATKFKVAIGSSFYEYTSTGLEADANALAAAIKDELATKVAAADADAIAFDGKYAVTVANDVITITQKTAASTSDVLSVTAK